MQFGSGKWCFPDPNARAAEPVPSRLSAAVAEPFSPVLDARSAAGYVSMLGVLIL